MSLYTTEDVTETKVIVVGTRRVPNVGIASVLGSLLMVSDCGSVECNFCSNVDYQFGRVDDMESVMTNAIRHGVEYHQNIMDNLSS